MKSAPKSLGVIPSPKVSGARDLLLMHCGVLNFDVQS
jgi:hypothetical protein